jgi:effector-binding domain-containing protein
MPPRIHAGRLATVAALLASSSAMAIEEPSFRVLERDGAFELREYAPHVVAETRVEAEFERAGNAAFQRLFRYISGNNVAQQKIAMTAPVTQSRSETGGEKIAMTAPVTQVAAGNGYRVAFTLPASYTLETAPTPIDKTIEIRAVPAQLVASWRYSGRWTESNYREHEAKLRAAIAARNLEVAGEPILARYNPPFMPSFLRRNEVLIPVKRPAPH